MYILYCQDYTLHQFVNIKINGHEIKLLGFNRLYINAIKKYWGNNYASYQSLPIILCSNHLLGYIINFAKFIESF
jgi:hypothetical protein